MEKGGIESASSSSSSPSSSSSSFVPLRLREFRQMHRGHRQLKGGMRSFGKYVPQEVVRSLLDGGSEACLGVERRNMTLMFTDIARFTSISEQLSPNELVTLMSEYFSAMTAVLHAHEGTLLEFIGDAILACWNAPVAVDGHAVNAVETALRMNEVLAQMQGDWSARGFPQVDIRIGLHT
jgi:adenylate cyclase